MVHFTSMRTKRFLAMGRDLLLVVTAVVVFVAGAAVTIYVVMREPIVRTPTVVGRPLAEAERLAREAGLQLHVRGTDARSPMPIVVEQWPPPGMAIKRGQLLRVRVEQKASARSPEPAPSGSEGAAAEPTGSPPERDG